MKKPLVSIIIPTFNRCERLKKTVNSCLSQTYKNIEVIIVDDGSTDNTKQTFSEFNDSRIKYYYQTNKGLPKALNFGFSKASGDYLTWISDDNLFKINAIEIMVDKMKQYKEPVFVYADMDIYYENLGQLYYKDYGVQNRIYMGNYIGACFLYHRVIWEEIGGYDSNLYLAEDYDYWIRVYEKFKMIHIPKSLYIYFDHKETLSRTKRAQVINALEKVYKKMIVIIKHYLKLIILQTIEIYIFMEKENLQKEYLKIINSKTLKVF